MKKGNRPRRAVALLAATAVVTLAGSLSAAGRAAAAFPGDNGKIAFASNRDGNWEIYVMDPDGANQSNLTNNAANDSQPAWSADGQKIAFTSDRDGNQEIYVMNADGSGQTDLTNDAADDSYPAWSPDGTKIAFVSDRDGENEIYVMNADGSDQTQLTQLTGGYGATDPAWSPDGTKIAFSYADDIWMMNADGSGLTALTTDEGSYVDYEPNWSPDGLRLVFFHENWIDVINANGSGQTDLQGGTVFGEYPAWSPDGTQIAFQVLFTGSPFDIYVMNADGSGKTDLTNNPAQDVDPDWQPLPVPPPPPFANLRLRMAGPRRIGPGDPITYAIRVRNEGPAKANGVVVSDPLPAGTSFIRAIARHGSCVSDPASGALTCSLGSMGDGSVRTIIVVARVTGADTTIANTASVSSLTPEPNLKDNSATVVTRVR